MPYRRKEDKAAQMRRYRRQKAQEKVDFERELKRINEKVARDLRRKFPGMFPSKRTKRRPKK